MNKDKWIILSPWVPHFPEVTSLELCSDKPYPYHEFLALEWANENEPQQEVEIIVINVTMEEARIFTIVPKKIEYDVKLKEN